MLFLQPPTAMAVCGGGSPVGTGWSHRSTVPLGEWNWDTALSPRHHTTPAQPGHHFQPLNPQPWCLNHTCPSF